MGGSALRLAKVSSAMPQALKRTLYFFSFWKPCKQVPSTGAAGTGALVPERPERSPIAGAGDALWSRRGWQAAHVALPSAARHLGPGGGLGGDSRRDRRRAPDRRQSHRPGLHTIRIASRRPSMPHPGASSVPWPQPRLLRSVTSRPWQPSRGHADSSGGAFPLAASDAATADADGAASSAVMTTPSICMPGGCCHGSRARPWPQRAWRHGARTRHPGTG